MIDLTGTEIESFRANGFLRLRGITDDDELRTLIEAFDALLVEDLCGPDRGARLRTDADRALTDRGTWTLANPHHRSARFRSTVYEQNALAVASRLADAGAVLAETYVIYKPPIVGAPTPWHQDEGYFDERPPIEYLSFWLALQRVTPDSGCLWYLAGSHRAGVFPHRPVSNVVAGTTAERTVDLDSALLSTGTPCPLEAGDAVVHTLRTLHSAGPNTSGRPRRALVLDIAVPSAIRGSIYGPRRRRRRDERGTARHK